MSENLSPVILRVVENSVVVGFPLTVAAIAAGFRPWSESGDPELLPSKMRDAANVAGVYGHLLNAFTWLSMSCMILFVATSWATLLVLGLLLLLAVILGMTVLSFGPFPFYAFLSRWVYFEQRKNLVERARATDLGRIAKLHPGRNKP